ncbi:MAG: radical SAM protein [Clostridia bacterium]|nr:radical SAM protein [Clostridia bacterium]
MEDVTQCMICPRKCGADRTSGRGRCGAGRLPEVSHVMIHHWEEPCISGVPDSERGSGAVFFTHCPLGCVFCQNGKISRPGSRGEEKTADELCGIFLGLEEKGAYNINLVSPTQYSPWLIEAVKKARQSGLSVPVVWNTGGYETAETIASLADTVDIFLTDFKYCSPFISNRLSSAPEYAQAAREALKEMYSITGPAVFGSEKGTMILKKGVLIRNIVMPSLRKDSEAVMDILKKTVPPESVILSLMAQYTPDFLPAPKISRETGSDIYGKMRRRITTFEYESVLKKATGCGFRGYAQERSSATRNFTPDF